MYMDHCVWNKIFTYLLTYLLECTLKQEVTQKPLHQYGRILAFRKLAQICVNE